MRSTLKENLFQRQILSFESWDLLLKGKKLLRDEQELIRTGKRQKNSLVAMLFINP